MTSASNRRPTWPWRPRSVAVARDPAARFAHDLATRPPSKNVASVKAASDAYAAGLRSDEHGPVEAAGSKPKQDE